MVTMLSLHKMAAVGTFSCCAKVRLHTQPSDDLMPFCVMSASSATLSGLEVVGIGYISSATSAGRPIPAPPPVILYYTFNVSRCVIII
jgi:hypothetical protein